MFEECAIGYLPTNKETLPFPKLITQLPTVETLAEFEQKLIGYLPKDQEQE